MPQPSGSIARGRRREPAVSACRDEAGLADYPVREYIGAMASELARMARWDGDDRLAVLLDIAAGMAAQPHPA